MGPTNVLAAAPRLPDEDPQGETGALREQVTTGGSYSAHSGNATRAVNDLHVPGALGTYGLDFTRYWNSVHNEDSNESAHWPTDFGSTGWSHSWRWVAAYRDDEIIGDGEISPDMHRTWITSITITYPDGHASKFKISRVNFGVGWRDFRGGPPYLANHGERDWPGLGHTSHDYLEEMAPNGFDFYLRRGDGGSVHFVAAGPAMPDGNYTGDYEAREVFDPYGFRTELTYTNGFLTRVLQDGDRWLDLTWGYFSGYTVPFITKVETGGNAAGQSVTYGYSQFPYPNGGNYVLAQVDYPNEPAPGQTASAYYTYGNCFGDTEPCPGQGYSDFPLLKVANDPHYSGPMTRIRYTYGGGHCDSNGPGPTPPPSYFDNVFFSNETIKEEKNDKTRVAVARFESFCGGERRDYNGLGGVRKICFGHSAIDSEIGAGQGWDLMKVTDFGSSLPGATPPPSRKQRGSEAWKVWDARHIETDFQYLDHSGSPSMVHHPSDGSTSIYDRIDPANLSGSVISLDTSRMHNPHYHWLFSKTDENGKQTLYRRDQRRRVTDVIYTEDGSSEHFEYNDWNQVTSHKLTSGAIQTYEYNAAHQLIRESNSVDIALNPLDYTEYRYYGPGYHPEWTDRLATVTDGRARLNHRDFSTRMTYNGRHQVITVEYAGMFNTSNQTVRYEYDTYGNRTVVIDEMGHRKEYAYDTYRRCISQIEWVNGPGPDGSNVETRRWDWIYDRDVDGVMFGASSHTSKEWRVQIEPAFNDAGDRRMTARTFDVNNRITWEQTGWIQPRGAIGISNPWYQGPDIETHHFTYDENGQKQTYTDPIGRVTAYGYDLRNRLSTSTEYPAPGSTSTPRTTETGYDPAGNKLWVKFPDNQTQQWRSYDAFGQPGQFEDELHVVTDFQYWPWGPMKKLARVITHRQGEDQPTDFTPDELGRPRRTTFPDGSYEESKYQFGQIDTWQTRKKQIKMIVYDPRGREISNNWGRAPDADPLTHLAHGISRVWDPAGRLLSLSNVFSTIDYEYDDAGQVKSETTTVTGSGAPKVVSYWRYPNGSVARVTYPSTLAIQRTYTSRGQLETVQDISQWHPFVSYSYLKDGKVDYQYYGNGTKTDFDYDGRGFIGSVSHERGGVQLAKQTYWRDDRDRILAWEKGPSSTQNPRENGRGDRFEYDDAGQLKKASYQAQNAHLGATLPERTDEFAYDWMGNRQGPNKVASRGVMNFAIRDNRLNQYELWENNLPGSQHWGTIMWYDDAAGGFPPEHPHVAPWLYPGDGVMMADGWIVAGFDALNQPEMMHTPDFQGTDWLFFGYDPLGRCVKRWISSDGEPTHATPTATYFYYDGWNLIQETGLTARTYVHGARVDEIVARAPGTGGWLYHYYDARGNCIMLTDAIGGLQEVYEYDAFGQPYVYTGNGNLVARKFGSPAGNRFLFTGREWLKDVRVYDFRARLYQPELGRFLQPDPKQFDAGDYNLYRYCHNDPVNKSDPTGLTLTSTGGGDWDWFNGGVAAEQTKTQHAVAVTVEFVRNPRTTESVDEIRLAKGGLASGETVPSFNVNEYPEESKTRGELNMHVKYADGPNSKAGPKTMAHTRRMEPEHEPKFDAFVNKAQALVKAANERIRFTSTSEAKKFMEGNLREEYNKAYAESRELDNPFSIRNQRKDSNSHLSPYPYDK